MIHNFENLMMKMVSQCYRNHLVKPESPGAKRKNWMNTSPATSPDEPPPGLYPSHKSEYAENNGTFLTSVFFNGVISE
jgi:hypothetical protein